MEYLRLLLLGLLVSLTGCYYTHDIKNQTMGSFAGGMGAGVILAHSGTALATTGAGVIVGSMIGSMFGQHFDNYSPLMRDNPIYSPVNRYYYKMFRPTLEVECFKSGKIYYRNSSHLPSLVYKPPIVNQLDDNGVTLCHPQR